MAAESQCQQCWEAECDARWFEMVSHEPYRFTINGSPRTKKNHGERLMRYGRSLTVPSKAYREWHAFASGQAFKIKAVMRAAGIELPITQRINVRAVFYQDQERRADECGYMQALGDLLQDVGILENDRLIHWAGVRLLVDRSQPRIEVDIQTAEDLRIGTCPEDVYDLIGRERSA
jgi:Holliday junction resolvase RusA-like endonuclease